MNRAAWPEDAVVEQYGYMRFFYVTHSRERPRWQGKTAR